MKIKVIPGDFLVKEIRTGNAAFSKKPGPFKVYWLEKSGISLFDAVKVFAERLSVNPSSVSYSGIKDKHGSTGQYVAVPSPQKPNGYRLPDEVILTNLTANARGFTDNPLSAAGIEGNFFSIVMRDCGKEEVAGIAREAEIAARWGVVNYFDDQRFGSARHGKGFPGKAIYQGKRERALRLFFEPSAYDPAPERKARIEIMARWGNWASLLEQASVLSGSHEKIIRFLSRQGCGKAFTKAIELIERPLLLLMLNAYQDWLCNLIMTDFLKVSLAGEESSLFSVPYGPGDLTFYRSLTPDLFGIFSGVSVPVPGYDTVFAAGETGETLRKITEAVLAREEMALPELKARQIYRAKVTGKERSFIVVPRDMNIGEIERDERYPGKWKIRLEFSLPRGSYATIVIKRCTGEGKRWK